jgi:hypothetical protein
MLRATKDKPAAAQPAEATANFPLSPPEQNVCRVDLQSGLTTHRGNGVMMCVRHSEPFGSLCLSKTYAGGIFSPG